MNFAKRLPWCVLYVDTERGVVLQQWWKYDWKVATIGQGWTPAEQRTFHKSVRRQIQRYWGDPVRLRIHTKPDPRTDSLGHAEGPPDGGHVKSFVNRFAASGVPVHMDIRWVLSGGQWDVTVWKSILDAQYRVVGTPDSVSVERRRIVLHSRSTSPITACGQYRGEIGHCFSGHLPIPHEFGHTFDIDDEYYSYHTHYVDFQSIMNLGQQLRVRHFDTVIDELNTMVPGVNFSVGYIRQAPAEPRSYDHVGVDPDLRPRWEWDPNAA